MKKTIKSVALVLLFVMIASLFTACGGSEGTQAKDEGLVGKWEYKNGIVDFSYVFEKDGKGYYEMYFDGQGGKENFTYEDKGTTVILQYESASVPNEYAYLIKGDCLNIADDFGGYISFVKNGGKEELPTDEELKEIFGIDNSSDFDWGDDEDFDWDDEDYNWDDEDFDLDDEELIDEDEDVPYNPFEYFYVDYFLDETCAMSTFMMGGYYTIVGDTVYGLVYSMDGTANFAKFDLVRKGDFAEAENMEVLFESTLALDVTYYDGYIYFLDSNGGLYRMDEEIYLLEEVTSNAYDYFHIYDEKAYYCNADYKFCCCELDGSNEEIILDKEVYYPYCFTYEWIVYQDDSDNEALHMYHVPSETDVAITNVPSYTPIVYGSDLFFIITDGNVRRLAKLDLGSFVFEYDETSETNELSYDMEISEREAHVDFTINWDGNFNNCLETGMYMNDWTYMENPEGKYEIMYTYLGADYDIYWRYDADGYVESGYVTLNETGGSCAIPRI